jgi:alkylation response protein AidB-like acyl-CoA dehydrogenase
MNFSFSEDQVLLRSSVRAALDEQCTPARVRAMMDEGVSGYDEALWAEMAKLGWLGLPFPGQGGPAAGLVELALVLEEMGRACPGPYFGAWCWAGSG